MIQGNVWSCDTYCLISAKCINERINRIVAKNRVMMITMIRKEAVIIKITIKMKVFFGDDYNLFN